MGDDTTAAFVDSPFEVSVQYSFNVIGASGYKSDGPGEADS